MLDHARARLVRRHRDAHRVDVRAGHDGRRRERRRASSVRTTRDNDGFSRLTERQGGLGLTHPGRGAGGEHDATNHGNFRQKISRFATRNA